MLPHASRPPPFHLAVMGATYYSSSDLRRGGVLALNDSQHAVSLATEDAQKLTEMRMSFALPLRRAFRVLR